MASEPNPKARLALHPRALLRRAGVLESGVPRLMPLTADRFNAADLIDGQRKLVAEYKSKYDTEFVAHTVTGERLKTEQNLRAIAEAQRNEAQRKCRAYLARSLEGATEDDVNAVLADLFAPVLAVVPPSKPRLSDTGDSALLDPFSEM